MFPKEIFIGTIETFDTRKGESNYDITVSLNTKFSETKYVYVIRNFNQEAQLDIETE